MCTSKNNGIGVENELPWENIEDMQFFKKITTQTINEEEINSVIMGRETWESLNMKPLENRHNVVISESIKTNLIPHYNSTHDALTNMPDNVENNFIIGGKELYESCFCEPNNRYLYLNELNHDYECDTFLENDFLHNYILLEEHKINESLMSFEYLNKFYNVSHEEHQYLEIISNIIYSGIHECDRTGTGVICEFGFNMCFDLSNSFPLFTTEYVHWESIVEELLWFINGNTNSELLDAEGVEIWNNNGSSSFLEEQGFIEREEGDLGPVYGFQWRHFGAEYINHNSNYTGKGVDQLNYVINTIEENPNSRRILLISWNPIDLSQMALPPCHVLAQFFVENDELNCSMYQRSCDIGLGVPFNVASYSLLTYIIAKTCNLEPGEFFHFLGDTHIYNNHIESLELQIQKEPFPFPILHINEYHDDISNYEFEDFQLLNYEHHEEINLSMS